ncbi:Fc.00g089380.m01.CDS01 [Cosmosporella sp. VM-42]
MVHGGTLEALQSQPGPSRRTRPPDIELVITDENRVPLRPEKANRRESRLGLRNIFGRSKAPKETEIPTSPRDIPKPAGIRASIVDMNNWPYSQSAPQSEPALTAAHSSRHLSTMAEEPLPGQFSHQQNSASSGKQRAVPAGKLTRGPMGTWNLPPLFKAFPQAIKHMTLPATSIPADTILRIQERKTNAAREEAAELLSPSNDRLGDREKSKKKHRRNPSFSGLKFEWTNKIYVLVTSGYLLQYAGEGAFDRLPEKVLHLGKDSVAFASDVIPGRHWVIQVSSVMESDGTTTSDSRSLFSRLPFRATERRQATNFLMVFETAEDMEGWISTLRREIEALGGKKSLSETGKPKVEEDAGQLRQQPSQRTLVVRDPDRLSRVGSQAMAWQDPSDHDGSVATLTDLETANDQSVDDMSTTNSVVSHDGRQLDNLRDSGNRLSFISSGQRTIVTSAGSSPESSPTADAFPSRFDDKSQDEEVEHQPETRLRPNAAAILDRRQSMQTMGQVVDFRGGMAVMRPQSTYGPDAGIPYTSRTPTPNFSVPHSSSRRFSYARNTPLDTSAPIQPVIGGTEQLYHQRSTRRSPPTTLSIARPLSMVADQPSPMEQIQERPATRHGADTKPLSPTQRDMSYLPQVPNSYDLRPRRSSLLPAEEVQAEANRPSSSHRHSSTRPWRNFTTTASLGRNFKSPLRPPPGPRMHPHSDLPINEEASRCRSSLEIHGSPHSDASRRKSRSLRRASMVSSLSEKASLYSISMDLPPPFAPESLPSPLPPPSAPLPPIPNSASNPHLKADLHERALFNRRSMPQLNEVPPPLPPPTCALPPIPRRPSMI